MLFQADRWLDIHQISTPPMNSHNYYLCCPKSYKSIKRFQVKIVPSKTDLICRFAVWSTFVRLGPPGKYVLVSLAA